MRTQRTFGLGVGALLLASPLAGRSQEAPQQASQVIEEVVVTGTYIRRQSQLDSPSPLITIGYEDIENLGVNEISDIEHLARRVVDEMRTPFLIEGHDIEIGTSIGIAMAPDNGTDADELIRKADAAVYVSKTSGRGTFKFC